MPRFPLTSTAKLAFVVAVSFFAATSPAQTPAPETSQPPASDTAQKNADSEWLAKTSRVYFSSAKAGLAGFNCDVHPDWKALFASANKGANVPPDDAYVEQLKKVQVKMHARMLGGSTIEWVASSPEGQPANGNSDATTETLHQTVQQILEGFMQFWSPFMEVSIVPQKTDGIEIAHTPTSHTIHAKQGTTELTEIFNNELVLEHFNVQLAGTSIKLSPSFEPTPQGLRVKTFAAEILPAGAPPTQTQKMLARVDYQTVNDQAIPGQLSIDVSGTGSFNFTFDGCSTEAN
jgi:hypothetical protein